ncbi:34614_t:CDS:2, partial [Racocetra persica]
WRQLLLFSMGYCGSTPEFCDPNQGCQSGYGFCDLSNDSNIDDGIQVIDTCQNPYALAGGGPRSWTNDLLDKLDEYGIKATIFVNGHNENDYCIYDFAEILQRDKLVIWDVDTEYSIDRVTESESEENFSNGINSQAIGYGYWFDTVARCNGD